MKRPSPQAYSDNCRAALVQHSSRVILSVLFAILVVLCAARILNAQSQPVAEQQASPLHLEYHLSIPRPTTHLAEVEIVVSQFKTSELDFVLPAWAPGRYAIYDFAKNVQQFSAVRAQDHPLSWEKVDKQTWRVDTANTVGTVTVRYRVFGNDLTGSFSQIDSTHANLNGPSVFMYVAGHKPDPLTLTVNAPEQWKLISGFSESTSQRTFQVRNYDQLIDTPMEITADCSIDQFQDAGKTFIVAVHDFGEDSGGRSGLVDGLKKIVHTEMALMPEPDFQHYTFIFHFASDLSMGDGMEHLNSTEIMVRGSLASSLEEALETAAHEFLHVWNVKRLRPAALGPFDYTRENYTRSLWFAEGVTSYLAYLSLLRSGVWTRDQFLSHLADEVSTLESEPGRKLMSAESSSFNAWFYDRSPQMQETNFANSTISYYNKGLLLGLLLDLKIRSLTQGKKSLRDVLASMYQKFYEAPPAGYYGPGHGYEEKDIQEAAENVADTDLSSFFERYVRGTDLLPYDELLKPAGLRLRVEVAPDAPPSLGILVQPEATGVRIFAVVPGGAADRAGLSRDDILIAVDDQSLATEDLGSRLRAYQPGAKVPFTVERHGQRQIIYVTLGPPTPGQYLIEDLPDAAPEQIALRNSWLEGKN